MITESPAFMRGEYVKVKGKRVIDFDLENLYTEKNHDRKNFFGS